MKKKQKVFIILPIILILFSAIALPSFLKARKTSQRNACLNNLRRIDGPMSCCVPMSMRLAEGDPIDPTQVAQYIKGGQILKCPTGCEYEIEWVVGGPPPKCPYHGDLLGTNAVHKH